MKSSLKTSQHFLTTCTLWMRERVYASMLTVPPNVKSSVEVFSTQLVQNGKVDLGHKIRKILVY